VALRREAYINLLDLAAFVLVTPDIVGKERLDSLREVVPNLWLKAITYFADQPLTEEELSWVNSADHWFFEVAIAGGILALFDELLPKESRNLYRVYLAGGICFAIIEIQELWKATAGTPVSSLLLLAGALLFTTSRILAIYFLQHEEQHRASREEQLVVETPDMQSPSTDAGQAIAEPPPPPADTPAVNSGPPSPTAAQKRRRRRRR
jgi:hypothetical protein